MYVPVILFRKSFVYDVVKVFVVGENYVTADVVELSDESQLRVY